MSEQHTRRGTRKMIWLAVAAFGFAFAMVPMYNIACEKIFGVKLDNTAAAAPVQADLVQSAMDRLVDADEMGSLFKVMGLAAPNWPDGAGFQNQS